MTVLEMQATGNLQPDQYTDIFTDTHDLVHKY
jgi:hypothetical protein